MWMRAALVVAAVSVLLSGCGTAPPPKGAAGASELVSRATPDSPAARRNLVPADLPDGFQLSADSPLAPNPAATARPELPAGFVVEPTRCPMSPVLADSVFHGRFTRISAENRRAGAGFAFGWSADSEAGFNFVALERDQAQCDRVRATWRDGAYREMTTVRLDTGRLGGDECFGVTTLLQRAVSDTAAPQSEKSARVGCRVGSIAVFGVLGELGEGETLATLGEFLKTMKRQLDKVRAAG
ncbi:hypothetical protein D5S18_07545 [Nocardia panacis]|uniref:Sensor domain-containing protein n=2 Tax=Nocardia panacis TaxID=2340916 RepID=A0A3A4KBW1_9NOCA|nr:hypothetical protein D5S18_07545 [Nocardia panacis]